MELCSLWKVTVCRWKDLSWGFAVRSSANMEIMCRLRSSEVPREGGGVSWRGKIITDIDMEELRCS